MSYIRCGYPLRYVKGNSEDYIFLSPDGIEDYGSISDSGFVELLFRHWDVAKVDEEFKNHLLKRLAKRLEVQLREKPLTEKQWLKQSIEEVDKFFKELEVSK